MASALWRAVGRKNPLRLHTGTCSGDCVSPEGTQLLSLQTLQIDCSGVTAGAVYRFSDLAAATGVVPPWTSRGKQHPLSASPGRGRGAPQGLTPENQHNRPLPQKTN